MYCFGDPGYLCVLPRGRLVSDVLGTLLVPCLYRTVTLLGRHDMFGCPYLSHRSWLGCLPHRVAAAGKRRGDYGRFRNDRRTDLPNRGGRSVRTDGCLFRRLAGARDEQTAAREYHGGVQPKPLGSDVPHKALLLMRRCRCRIYRDSLTGVANYRVV